jgi:hypothetical protein
MGNVQRQHCKQEAVRPSTAFGGVAGQREERTAPLHLQAYLDSSAATIASAISTHSCCTCCLVHHLDQLGKKKKQAASHTWIEGREVHTLISFLHGIDRQN